MLRYKLELVCSISSHVFVVFIIRGVDHDKKVLIKFLSHLRTNLSGNVIQYKSVKNMSAFNKRCERILTNLSFNWLCNAFDDMK